MSDEDSFVILGSSPMPSLLNGGNSMLRNALEKDGAVDGEPQSIFEEIEPATEAAVKPNENSILTTSSLNTNGDTNSLAASFILGEVKADVLKNSVYSQFPSLCSMEACAEDVVKLQNMMTEYLALKQTLDKVNHTMQQYYKITQEWRQEAANKEKQYQEQLQQCQAQIEKLSEENRQLKIDMDSNIMQMREVEEIRQKEHDELRQSVSEKTSLIYNMRVEIEKLSQQQLTSYEFVPPVEGKEGIKPTVDFIKRDEHEKVTKELQRELSKLLAENLDFKDIQKTYIDEIDCLKVNLTSAQELLNKTSNDVIELTARNAQKDEEFAHLQTQIEVYRRDFEMERADREKNAGEKEQYLLDLRALQRRNQELIEALAEANKLANKLGQASVSTSVLSTSSVSSSSSSTSNASRNSSLRDEQRPVRVLDPTGAAAKTADNVLRCPICSKSFNALSVLQTHVNDCLDKN